MVALWSNEDDNELDSFNISAYDIDAKNGLLYVDELPIKKIHTSFSKQYYDKRTFPDDKDDGILCDQTITLKSYRCLQQVDTLLIIEHGQNEVVL